MSTSLSVSQALPRQYGNYQYRLPSSGSSLRLPSGLGKTFTVKAGGQEHTFTRKPDAQIEQMLHEHADGERIQRAGNPVVRWDRNWVGSNEPCEDRSAVIVVPRLRGAKEMTAWWKFWESSPDRIAARVDGDRDLTFFSIFDGHAGDATSELLSRTMHPTLALALTGLQAGQTWFEGKWKWIGGSAWDVDAVTATLQKAYVCVLQLEH